jgi:hypothetical protein
MMTEKQGKNAIRKMISKFLLRLVGLFHIGFGPYWFIQEIGFLGRIGRWDIAIAMALLTVLGFVLLLHPSCWAGLLTSFVYASWGIYQCLTMGFMLGLRKVGLGIGIPMAFIIFCALLATDSTPRSSDKNDNLSCDSK